MSLRFPLLLLFLSASSLTLAAEPPSISCGIPSGENEADIYEGIFIGSEYAGNDCLIYNSFVPLADSEAMVLEIPTGDTATLSIPLKNTSDKGWVSSCYITDQEKTYFKGYYPRKLNFIQDRNLIYKHCKGRAQPGTWNQYRFRIRLDRLPEADEHIKLAQWKAIPDSFRNMQNNKYHDNIWIKEGVTLATATADGRQFETDALIPLTLEIRNGFLALIARSDSSPFSTDKTCDFPTLTKVSSGKTLKCDKTSKATVIKKWKLEGMLTPRQWHNITLGVVWSRYEGLKAIPGRVSLIMDKEQLVLWNGDVGRNDHMGPYLTLGASMVSGNQNLEVSYRDMSIRYNLPGYNVNLVRNPNNYGHFKDTWVSRGRSRLGPYLHNQVAWGYGGGITGFFATPYYNVTRTQTIDLGRLIAESKNKTPEIFVGEEFSRTYCGDDLYRLKVTLLDRDQKEITSWTTGTKKAKGPCTWGGEKWITETHTFKRYKGTPRYIKFEDGGKDKEYWGGFYGSRMREATVIIKAPATK